MIKLFTMVMLIVTVSFAELSSNQLKKIQDVYNIGKSIKASDGMTFEKGLTSMMGQESSWGIEVIGDKYDKNGKLKSVYESSLGNFQIKLSTAKLTIKKFPHLRKKYKYLVYEGDSIYLKYEKNKAKMDYYQSILDSKTWRKRYNLGQEKAIKTLSWATRNYNKHVKIHNELVNKARKDTRLINKLLTDHRFGAEIGGHYLLSLYEHAIKKGWSNAYRRSIGRYNGGWSNWTYAGKVINRMKTLNRLIRQGKVKA